LLRLEALDIRRGEFRLTADFAVGAGERCAVIGPSGGGKSTLLAAIGGFLDPVSGRILWNGADITRLPPGARPLTTLFQDTNLFPHLTVAQNVGLGLDSRLKLDAAARGRVARVLERTGLAGLGDRLPRDLSGGQQSRAALARALLRARPVLLLDEPFAALGPALRAEMLDLVAEVLDETGAALMMVTHEPADARRLCPKTILVAEGRAEAPAPTSALLDKPPPALAAYLGH
jgi:thiamine transport system ATP-binding protein